MPLRRIIVDRSDTPSKEPFSFGRRSMRRRTRRSVNASVVSNTISGKSRRLKRLAFKLNNITAEKKYKLIPVNILVADTGTITPLSDIAQTSGVSGASDTTRIGDRILLRSLEVNLAAINGDPTNAIRVIIFQWLPGTTPLLGNILLDSAGGADVAYSPYTHDGRQSFRILLDKTFYLGSSSLTRTAGIHKYITRFPLRFIDYSDAVTTPLANGIWMLTVSDSTSATHPTVIGQLKLNYTDT